MRNQTTADRLKTIMKENDLKQVDIIKKCEPICKKINEEYNTDIKITKSDLSQWLSGLYEPGQKKLSILAEALNTNEVWLMGFDVENKPKKYHTYTTEEEMKVFKDVLIRKGFLNKNENLTEEDFNMLIDFAIANKQFIKKDKK